MLFSILCWIYATECMEVIPERANVVYMNPKYVYTNATVNVRRYGRKSRYYINVEGVTKHTWTNNMTFTLVVTQLLHNEYRPSFVELKYKLCDLINKEPFVGECLKHVGVVCPLPAGYHNIMNITANTENFPSVFPFEHGRIEVLLSLTDTKEHAFMFHIVATFKQKPKGK
ncbi:hypothetical protein PYW08_003572 [Mythimna loreyi]|uniref:Uncharacterized protein n=1 Tax=Mythimna loreyi TaxID=667449 RepID=A0ACC2QT18_9NEOP|nr:hypothetical protein PYW08_003572 [Mythimna loreyi]